MFLFSRHFETIIFPISYNLKNNDTLDFLKH